jgi:hypothetical protein
MLTYKLLTDAIHSKRWTAEAAALVCHDAVREEKIREFVHTAGDRLFREIKGNHFFFVGEKGAKETAKAISDLIILAGKVQAEFQALLRV